MDYKKAYDETIEQLYEAQVQLNQFSKPLDEIVEIMDIQNEVILKINEAIPKTTDLGRKEDARATRNKLIRVYNKIGFMWAELACSKLKIKTLQLETLDMSRKIEQLENELKVEKELN
jgi:DNA repair ATPase RecN